MAAPTQDRRGRREGEDRRIADLFAIAPPAEREVPVRLAEPIEESRA
jgi:hypothetical protein